MNDLIAERFRSFAQAEAEGSSALYCALSGAIAEDDFLLEIAAQSEGQPVPNLFLAAVHYLLASDRGHPLRDFYGSFTDRPKGSQDAYPAFKEFVADRRAEIVALLKTRLVQTNEVGRCAYLLPAFLFAAAQFGERPLALVEIGTSAGLNLLWDRYRYRYGGPEVYGDPVSPVCVNSSFRGRVPSVLAAPLPAVSHRIGLDINIVDTNDADQAAWLRALIWPEHQERRVLLNAAVRQRNEAALDLRPGDGFAMIERIAEEIPAESLLCVYHTHVANQISPDAREEFLCSIAQIGARRDMIHVFNNIHPHLQLTVFRAGEQIDTPLAKADGHARWIEWLHQV